MNMAKTLPPELQYFKVKFPESVRKLFRKIRPLHVYSRYYIDENDYAFKSLNGFSASPQCIEHLLDNVNVVLHYAESMFNTAMCDYNPNLMDEYLSRHSARIVRQNSILRTYGNYTPDIQKLTYQAKNILFDYQRKEKF